MRLVKFIFLALFIIILISGVVFIYKEIRPKKPEEVEESLKEFPIEVPIEENKSYETKEDNTSSIYEATSSEEKIIENNVKTPKLLYEKILLYPEIDYPFIYAYDPESKTIKELNLEDKTYKELYKEKDIQFLSFSEDKSKILFKKLSDFYLLDIPKDKLEKLPKTVKRAFWYKNDLYTYILTPETSYVALFKNDLEKFIDVYILNPDFEVLENGILVYENLRYTYSSPLILITKNKEKKVLLDNAFNLSLISNKRDLVFASLFEKNWKSYLIDINGNKLKEFNFGTLKEKCTFDNLLICGVPKNQAGSDPIKWYYYKENFEDRIIIFDYKKNELKYFDLNGKFDILKPKLTPLGIVFLNRFDNKLYVIPIENFSF